ncbi:MULTISPECIES: metal-dependent hydrolase [Arthrobacter]|uniref:Metal-dependent hydrolase n=2 Tax=Arthrobacter TaxID=1663 RepID=A0ABU9KP73_9MICC|nr:metal-dependent hydrolase [Arthrobacter sp. YJM1]MDP5228709.1 metal-dependent hydrolase [Arthrobacter sp. YJM1]
MMGGHHAATGAAVWLAVTTRLHVDLSAVTSHTPLGPVTFDVGLGLLHVSPLGVVAGALVTAGAALVPDADHRNATIAHSLPPVSKALCIGMEELAGGHRHGTHSLLGLALFTATAWVAGLWRVPVPGLGPVGVGAGILSILLVSFAAKALKLVPDRLRITPWIVGILVGGFIALAAPQEEGWFPQAMFLGVAAHIVGDALTVGGVNLLWPLSLRPPKAFRKIPVLASVWSQGGYMAVPLLGKAGSFREWLLLVPVSLYTVWALGTTVYQTLAPR